MKIGKQKADLLDFQSNSKRITIEEETRSGTMGTFNVGTSSRPFNTSHLDALDIVHDEVIEEEEVFHEEMNNVGIDLPAASKTIQISVCS